MKNLVRPTLVAMATKFGLGAESSRLPACLRPICYLPTFLLEKKSKGDINSSRASAAKRLRYGGIFISLLQVSVQSERILKSGPGICRSYDRNLVAFLSGPFCI